MLPLVNDAATHHPNHQGFTLVEILLVVVIIGVMAGLASLAIGSNAPRQLQQEAVRLQQRLVLAQDEAAFTQKNLGVLFTETGYQLLQYDANEDQWQALDAISPHADNAATQSSLLGGNGLYAYEIPVTASLELAGAPLKLARKKPSSAYGLSGQLAHRQKEEKDTLQPDLLLLANGETSPFTLTLQLPHDPRSTQTLHSDGFSPVTRSSHTTDR